MVFRKWSWAPAKSPKYQQVMPETRCAISASGQSGCAVASCKKSSAISRIGAGSPRCRCPSQRPKYAENRSEASSTRFANSRARPKTALVSGACCPLAQISALPRLVCKMQPIASRRRARRCRGELVGQFDRLAEVGGCLPERRAAQGLVAGLAPPFDCRLVEPGLGQMMGDEFRLGRGDRRELAAQCIGDLPVQDLPPAPEQGFVCGVLDQRMLEGVARFGRHA